MDKPVSESELRLIVENARLSGRIEGMELGIEHMKSELEFYRKLVEAQVNKRKASNG